MWKKRQLNLLENTICNLRSNSATSKNIFLVLAVMVIFCVFPILSVYKHVLSLTWMNWQRSYSLSDTSTIWYTFINNLNYLDSLKIQHGGQVADGLKYLQLFCALDAIMMVRSIDLGLRDRIWRNNSNISKFSHIFESILYLNKQFIYY